MTVSDGDTRNASSPPGSQETSAEEGKRSTSQNDVT